VELIQVFFAELVVFFMRFAGQDEGTGVHPMFQRILGGTEFAFLGYGTAGFGAIAAGGFRAAGRDSVVDVDYGIVGGHWLYFHLQHSGRFGGGGWMRGCEIGGMWLRGWEKLYLHSLVNGENRGGSRRGAGLGCQWTVR